MRVGWKAATSDKGIASFRYRSLMPIDALRSRGHDVELVTAEKLGENLGRYDAVVFSKSYRKPDHQLARELKAAGKQVIFDICDNHFYNPYNLASYRSVRGELLEMIGLADLIVCTTSTLAKALQAESGTTKPVTVVGDAVEFVQLPERPASTTKSLLWFGSHGSPNAPCGMNDLLSVEPLLRKLAGEHAFKLVVASNNRAKFESLAGYFAIPLEYAEWSIDAFPARLAAADAVIIPVSRNPFVNCKTHNRLTLALGAGVPVVADSIESYREFGSFCVLDDWENGLREVLEDSERALERAKPARRYLEEHWSMDQLVIQWESALGLPHALRISETLEKTAEAIALTESADDDAPAPLRSNGHGVARRAAKRYLGAVDAKKNGEISGWATLPLDSNRPLDIVLVLDGKTVARDSAQRRRGDLEASGFRRSDCGFSLKVPTEFCDGKDHGFEVIADGGWTVEIGLWRFEEPAVRPAPVPRPEAPIAAKSDDDLLIPLEEAPPPREEKLAVSLALATSTLTDNAAVIASIGLQKKLFADLEKLNEAVDTVRRIAARMILSAADQADAPAAAHPPRLIVARHERVGDDETPAYRTLS